MFLFFETAFCSRENLKVDHNILSIRNSGSIATKKKKIFLFQQKFRDRVTLANIDNTHLVKSKTRNMHFHKITFLLFDLVNEAITSGCGQFG